MIRNRIFHPQQLCPMSEGLFSVCIMHNLKVTMGLVRLENYYSVHSADNFEGFVKCLIRLSERIETSANLQAPFENT